MVGSQMFDTFPFFFSCQILAFKVAQYIFSAALTLTRVAWSAHYIHYISAQEPLLEISEKERNTPNYNTFN